MIERNDINLSEQSRKAFSVFEYSIEHINLDQTYCDIISVLPKRNSTFDNLSIENMVGCEIVCAAICHQINWDFLRSTIYEKVISDSEWLNPMNLCEVTSIEIKKMLSNYKKKERIREHERAKLIRSIGKIFSESSSTYVGAFLDGDRKKTLNEIESFFNRSIAFSNDPERKKTRLLLQNLSEYSNFSFLADYCKPAIDYHIIREFLRRGIIIPSNKGALDYIMNSKIRKEHTVAALRKVCSDAFYELSWITGFDIITLNTVEWWIGRSICKKEKPDCFLETEDSQWIKKKFVRCPFYENCYAVQCNNDYFRIVEPNYKGHSF